VETLCVCLDPCPYAWSYLAAALSRVYRFGKNRTKDMLTSRPNSAILNVAWSEKMSAILPSAGSTAPNVLVA